jgi:TetR/AcrR family transcriptional regulator
MENNTEEIIKQAAQKIFIEHGLAGARTQQIADEAKVNKALVNYYFRSKEKLFEIVFLEAFTKFHENAAKVLFSDKNLFEKIEDLVAGDIDLILENPNLALFILNETSKNQDMLKDKLGNGTVTAIFGKFRKQVEEEIKKGTIIKISAEELFMNTISLSIFPFVGRPFFQTLFEKNNLEFEKMIQKRKKTVAEFIIASIKV